MYKQISVTELQAIMSDSDLIIGDVRDKESFNAGHIDGAIHLTMTTLQEFVDGNDKSHAILVYCYHGISSQSVAQHLIDQGFSEVYSLIGGFEAWMQHQTSQKNK